MDLSERILASLDSCHPCRNDGELLFMFAGQRKLMNHYWYVSSHYNL
jgi:hypothetical protein